MEFSASDRIPAKGLGDEVMLERIKAIAYCVLDRSYPPRVDDEAFMHEVNLAYERTTLAESICNHDREEDGYCAKCHSWSDDET